MPFRVLPKKSLGIDIGTSAIRVVELSSWQNRIKLENYGEIQTLTLEEKPFRIFERSALLLPSQEISQALKTLLQETKIRHQEASFSIPDFSTFFTSIDFPPMKKKELEEAVRYEARRHVPLPLSEIVLDWEPIDKQLASEKEGVRVLLVAVPKEVINQYKEIAEASDLRLLALEAEVFSLIRALMKEGQETLGIIEIGAQSTTVSIVEANALKTTHSFDVSGYELTRILSRSLSISFEEAEVLKKTYGITSQGNLREILLPLIDLMISEVKKISQEYYGSEAKVVEKFILAGGSSLLPGLREYFTDSLKKEVVIANPFKEVFYPSILEETLEELGPSFSISLGVAKRNLE